MAATAQEPFAAFFASTPTATTPLGSAPVLVLQSGLTKQTAFNLIARGRLAANITYNVTATGSDITGDGSAGKPWATPQHAVDFILSNSDLANLLPTIQIGAGRFAGVQIGQTTGAGYNGALVFVGSGSGSTTLTAAGSLVNACCYCGATGIPYFSFNALSFDCTGGVGVNLPIAGCTGQLGDFNSFANADIKFVSTSGSPSAILVQSPSLLLLTSGNYGISGNWRQFYGLFLGGQVADDGGTWTLTGTPAFSAAFAHLETKSSLAVTSGSTSYSGSATGLHYQVLSGSNISAQGGSGASLLGPTFFPGNTAGTVDITSSYDGSVGVLMASGLPTTTQFPNSGSGGLYKDTSGGGAYVAYNDAGTIKKVSLT